MAVKQAGSDGTSTPLAALQARLQRTLTAQHGGLRLYQWLWLLFCVLAALAIAAPRILLQPLVYTAGASVQVDAAGRYSELYTAGAPDADYLAVQQIAIELLRAEYPELGSPTLNVAFTADSSGLVTIAATAATPLAARNLANDAAEALARSVRGAGGREILRNLLGWELVTALQGQPPPTPFAAWLRQIIRTSAFPLNRPVEPVAEQITVAQLAPEELSDLTRALEIRELQLSRFELPQLQRELPTANGAAAEQLERDLRRLNEGLQAIRGALDYLYTGFAAQFQPDFASDVYRSSVATLPQTPVDRRIPWLIGLAILGGLVFGAAGVAVDRTAGVMPKLREIWGYRELIRNLVLRDLRARYKGSALGYLWTQLAPLMLMLVFWLVFSIFFQAPIAMFPIFIIVALLPWNYCAEAVIGGTRSVLDNANLIKKVFFPREVLPLVSVLSSLLNFVLSLPMLFLVMAVVQLFYAPLEGRLNFSWTFSYLPVLMIIQTIFLAGVTLLLSALAVFFRDVVHLIGIFMQFWFFLTPVVYSLDVIDPALARVVRWLNPMASLVEFYRDILYGNAVTSGLIPTPGIPALDSVLRVLLTALAMAAFGYWFFQRQSARFGEEL